MKVLYIKRSLADRSPLRRIGSEIRRRLFFFEQEGYFVASLHEAYSNVTYSTARKAYQRADSLSKKFDLMVVNSKTDTLSGLNTTNTLYTLGDVFDLPSILVKIRADVSYMPENSVCDQYDLIFRRECYSNTDRYDLSQENKQKLRTTMLPCLFVPLPRYFFSSWFERFFIPQAPSDIDQYNKEHDIFFCGQYSQQMPIRSKVVRALKEQSEIDFYGGLQPKNKDVEVHEEVQFPRLNPDDYVRALKSSRIVLALDGIGQFTFRHLEAWHFGGFLMSSPSIREINLPLPAEEGTHYIAFDDTKDLVKLVKYYLKQEKERKRIAEAGKEMFEQNYDPAIHGQYIARQVDEITENN